MMMTTSSSSSAATNMDMSESVKEVVPELPIHHRLDRSGYLNAGKQNVSLGCLKNMRAYKGWNSGINMDLIVNLDPIINRRNQDLITPYLDWRVVFW